MFDLEGSDDYVVQGDNLRVLAMLPSDTFQLVYIDPPFNTGTVQERRSLSTTSDAAGGRIGFGGRRYSTVETGRIAYVDAFDDYEAFLAPRLVEARRVLTQSGTLYLHLDWREAHHCKVLLDDMFGRDCFLNEVIWAYDFGGRARDRWPAKHDTILVYVKEMEQHFFDQDSIERIPYLAPGLVTSDKAARGKLPTDVWWHTIVATSGKEKTGYPNQKPAGVLRRVLAPSSRPGDWVLDFFAGSGTTGAVAKSMGRRFVLVDSSPDACKVMAERIGPEGVRYVHVDAIRSEQPAKEVPITVTSNEASVQQPPNRGEQGTLLAGGGYDVEAVRACFPALSEGAAHFDGPGGSQIPSVVADAVSDTLRSAIANRARVTPAERRADDIVVAARGAMGDFLGADAEGVVFGRSMTQLTFDFARTLAKTWGPGDEVVVTRLDHDANIRPWVHAASAVGATVRWAEFDPATGELGADDIRAVLSPRTRLVAVTAASNLTGARPPVADISDLVHEAGALFYVDAVHFAAHCSVDMSALGADLVACSPYKFFGPHCGVLAGRLEVLEELSPDRLLPSSDAVPERFEFGTLPYELLAGTTAAVDFIAGLAPRPEGSRRERLVAAMTLAEAYEDGLRHDLESRLSELPGLVSYSRASRRTPTLLVSFEAKSSTDAQLRLAEVGVNAPAGSFYALEPSRALGLGDEGALRIGLAAYTNASDIDRLVAGLTTFALSDRPVST